MEPLSITAGGGEVNDLTAAPGSSYVCCDMCGANDELKEWISDEQSDAQVYHYCKVCWFDAEESYAEIKLNRCATCSDGEATHRYLQEDGTYVEVCEGCFLLSEEEEQDGCDECGSDTDFTEEYQLEDGEIRNLCENCRPEFLEPLPKRQALECDACKKNPATHTFLHLDSRKFKLCGGCWAVADHTDDYGADFGSVPRIRLNGKNKFCECPVVCNTMIPTRCDLCDGIVVTVRDS